MMETGMAMMLMMGIAALVVIVLAVAGGVWLARTLTASRERSELHRGGAQRDEAQQDLRRRYAAGEITREEYLQGKADIEE